VRTSRIAVAALLAACALAPAAQADPIIPPELEQIIEDIPVLEDICYERSAPADAAPEKVCVPVGDELHDLLVD
jgi:hypothetical protein